MFDTKKSEDKVSYEAPKLTVYGDVLEMTAGGTNGNTETRFLNKGLCGNNLNKKCGL